MSIRGSQRITDPNPEEKYQALQKFSRDLTDLARLGKLDPVIGRDDEIRRIVQVLSRRTKNNPVLIGEPGSAKPPSLRVWPSASWPAMSPKPLKTDAGGPRYGGDDCRRQVPRRI
jgi:hypothetical protein